MTSQKEKKSELSEEEEWNDKSVEISDITYRTPGWRDTVYLET